MEVYRDKMEQWMEERRKVAELFKIDAINESGLYGHPKAEKVYNKAYTEGHSGGYSDIFNLILEYADLIL